MALAAMPDAAAVVVSSPVFAVVSLGSAVGASGSAVESGSAVPSPIVTSPTLAVVTSISGTSGTVTGTSGTSQQEKVAPVMAVMFSGSSKHRFVPSSLQMSAALSASQHALSALFGINPVRPVPMQFS